jgi:hypothetical protein
MLRFYADILLSNVSVKGSGYSYEFRALADVEELATKKMWSSDVQCCTWRNNGGFIGVTCASATKDWSLAA